MILQLANPEKVADLAYTLAIHREKLPCRAFAIVDGSQIAEISAPAKASPTSVPYVMMVFSGQGAQWLGIGRELIRTNVLVQEDILEMDRVLKNLQNPPSWSLIGKCDARSFVNVVNSNRTLTIPNRGADPRC